MEKVKKIPGVPNGMDWEVKDRIYYLTNNDTPLVFTLPGRHTRRKPLLWFDKVKGYQRELRYATNQPSPLADEQKGSATLGHIVFRNGALLVSAREQSLQKLLSIYHPLKTVLYKEHSEVEIADNELSYMELEIEALNIAKDLDVDVAEGILRVELGSKVSKMTSKEIKRDLLVFARRNPGLFLELVQDDNVQLRNFGIKAVEAGLVKLSPDNRQFNWASNGRKLITVPFDEHPYSALAAWFKTDEGLEVFKNLEKRLN
jgi:hypothetical protein